MIADFLLFSASNDNFSSLRLQIYLSIIAAVAAIVVGVQNIILVWRVCLLQEEFESNRKKSRRRRRQLWAYSKRKKIACLSPQSIQMKWNIFRWSVDKIARALSDIEKIYVPMTTATADLFVASKSCWPRARKREIASKKEIKRRQEWNKNQMLFVRGNLSFFFFLIKIEYARMACESDSMPIDQT